MILASLGEERTTVGERTLSQLIDCEPQATCSVNIEDIPDDNVCMYLCAVIKRQLG